MEINHGGVVELAPETCREAYLVHFARGIARHRPVQIRVAESVAELKGPLVGKYEFDRPPERHVIRLETVERVPTARLIAVHTGKDRVFRTAVTEGFNVHYCLRVCL
jgi:hypothetical protein